MGFLDASRAWAKRLKRDGIALWFARRHPDTPWYAKALAVLTVGYALSPIDLIPDFIPVLGYLDDVILLPGLIWLTLRALPPHVLQESRVQAEQWIAQGADKPRSRVAAVVIVLVWIVAITALGWWAWRRWG
jgi:uncharacterized membrane protein YkvA (DUF1232 family)